MQRVLDTAAGGGVPTTLEPQGVNPPRDRGPHFSGKFRESKEKKRLHWLSRVVTKTHMQVEPLLPNVKKAATQTSLVLADGTY